MCFVFVFVCFCIYILKNNCLSRPWMLLLITSTVLYMIVYSVLVPNVYLYYKNFTRTKNILQTIDRNKPMLNINKFKLSVHF